MTRILTLGASVAAFWAVILCATSSDAAWWRQTGYDCVGYDNGNNPTSDMRLKNISGSEQQVACPAPDSNLYAKNIWTTVNIEAWLPNDTRLYGNGGGGGKIYAYVCISDWDGSSGNCGTAADSGSSYDHVDAPRSPGRT
ncbi:MAG: hypothetical protein IPI67_26660 [Myxococcales bacterium]|nr:hypothetical protein [Myxococcales bacterium]